VDYVSNVAVVLFIAASRAFLNYAFRHFFIFATKIIIKQDKIYAKRQPGTVEKAKPALCL
jgi:hypothetical protein